LPKFVFCVVNTLFEEVVHAAERLVVEANDVDFLSFFIVGQFQWCCYLLILTELTNFDVDGQRV
jgi:hypothetical protein